MSKNEDLDLFTEKPLPNILIQLNNLIKSIYKNLKHLIVYRKIFISTQERDMRLTICRLCEFQTTNGSRCTKCGCFIKPKVRLIEEKCPESKW